MKEHELSAEERLAVEAATEEYEMELRRQLDMTKGDTQRTVQKRVASFRKRLLENELADLKRSEAEIGEEESIVINYNLWAAVVVSLSILALVLVAGDSVESVSDQIASFMARNFSWLYILIGGGCFFFLAYLALSRFGSVVLGAPGRPPEFSTVSWYAMLLSTGIGSGLLFWGVGEPLQHYVHPPHGEPRSEFAAAQAMVYACFHWGLHIWAIFTVCAVSVAYYGFRKRKFYLMSSTLMDITQNNGIRQGIKVFTDLVATLAVIAGICTSLGMAVIQIAGGITHVTGIEATGTWGLIGIVAAMTVAFIGSAAVGLKSGIRILALINIGLALFLLLFVFFSGPTIFILKLFVDTLGKYIQHIPELSFKVDAFSLTYEHWMGHWTLFYFSWVIAWAPFVGVFVARISRGRTIRELIVGSLALPTAMVIFWFATFGGTALYLEHFQHADIADRILADVPVGLFVLFEQLPFSGVISMLAIALLFMFLVTSADSATFVVAMMTSQGDLEPQLSRKFLWGGIIALLTVSLVLAGGLTALQAATLLFALPFAIVMVLGAISMTLRLSVQIKARRT